MPPKTTPPPHRPPSSIPSTRRRVPGHHPTLRDIAAARLILEPWQWLTAPRFYRVERVPVDRPFLLVGNHTIMGVLDAPLLVLGLYDRTGVFVRSLGDHLHFHVPIWRDLLTRFGTIEGTPDNCRALMHAGEPILVFPGGGREVFKHKGEKYQLIWKNRLGFVRLAIEFGYPILPFATVGAEECYDILVDSDELRRTPIGPVLERVIPRAEEIPPIINGIGPLPRPQRFYFRFGTPIETTDWAGREDDDTVLRTVRDRVAAAIRRGIADLQRERDRDPQRALAERLRARLTALGEPAKTAPARPGRR